MNELKIDTIVELDIDDNIFEEDENNETGVEIVSIVDQPAIKVDFQYFSEKVKLDSYNDYPKAARENACRAIIWTDENGWGSCGEATGKRRASQLCMGENISRETIARMASFKRHQQHKDVPYDEGCGGLMWDAWGGDEGIAWAQRKLEQIDREEAELYKKKCKKEGTCKYATEEQQRAILDFAEDDTNGTYIGVDDIYLDFTKTKLGVTDVVKAISGLDILKRLVVKKDEPAETYWRYSGPPAQRDFCKAMMNLANRGKIFTTEEIRKMNNVANTNPGMGEGGSNNYPVLEFAGGVSCKHYFQKLKVFRGSTGTKVVMAVNQTDNEEEQNAMKSQNSNTPGPLGSIPNNARVNFSFNEEKRIVTGPLMIPNKFILRMQEDGSPYYIWFSRKTIRKMAEKFFKMNNHNNTDINHDEDVTDKNTLVESWISESMEYDKAYKLGYMLPPGTWYVSYKINDDDTWKKIKSGELNGFSLAGGFIKKMKAVNPELTLNEIKNILKQVKND